MLRRVVLGALTLAACAPSPTPPRAPAPAPPPPVEAPPAPAASATPPPPAPAPAEAPAPPPMDARTSRLLRMATIWGKVRYEHPWVATSAIDWDAAATAALPKMFDAQSDNDEAAAIALMLKSIHDPVTRVDPPARESESAAAAPEPSAPRVVNGVVFIPVRAADWHDVAPAGRRLLDALKGVKRAVIDLRNADRVHEGLSATAVDQVAAHLAWHAATGSVTRRVEHRGYRPQTIGTSGGYTTLLASSLPEPYAATKGPHPERVVFLAGDRATLPEIAWVMQHTGDAEIVIQGAPGPDPVLWTDDVSLPGGAVAHVRLIEKAGTLPKADLDLDVALPAAKVDEAAAMVAKRASFRRRAPDAPLPERPTVWRPDATYAEEPYPSHERRVLSLFRFWSVIHYFYPYLALMGGDDAWDHDFAEALPKFEAARNAGEYALAVAALAAKIPDGHVNVWGSEDLARVRGQGAAPFRTRVIEGQVVVTGIADPAAIGEARVSVGDVVDAIDGEPVTSLMARAARYFSASNDVTRAAWSANSAFHGDPTQKMELTLRGRGGETHKATVARTAKWEGAGRTGPVFQILDSGFGYVDLDRLEVADVDAMFAALDKTPAIVFDMRGYPHNTVWAVAPRLNVKKAKYGAQFFEPFVSPGNSTLSFFNEPIPPTDKPIYSGKTVMLVDERTMSQAEGTALFFEAASGTTFVGSQTAGADGDVTELTLPGGLHVSFSGHDVRHADGRQLQRVGIVPDVPIKPTVDGVRAGRDEVLERAVVFLQTGK